MCEHKLRFSSLGTETTASGHDGFDLEAMETSLQPWTCSERFVVSEIPWSGPHGCVEPPKHSGALRKGAQPGPILPFFVVKMVPV